LAWNVTEPLLDAALKMITAGYLDTQPVTTLADRLGISSRHLRRLFQQHLGTTPLAYARMQQTLFAKQLLTESHLNITDIAMAAAFGSVRQFNDYFKKVYGRSPRALRNNLYNAARSLSTCQLYLSYHRPYNFKGLLQFYARRAIPGIEYVDADSYARTFQYEHTQGWFQVQDVSTKQVLKVTLHCNRYDQLQAVVQRIRQMFDTATDAQAIHQQFNQNKHLAKLIKKNPGLRIAGCWSIDEACIRAVLGQRVSLEASIAMLSRVAAEYGQRLPSALCAQDQTGLCQLFPSMRELGSIQAKTVRIGGIQANTLARLAAIEVQPYATATELYQQLMTVKGIGDWTAQYAVMRGLGFPDAWLAGDVVVKSVLAANYSDNTDRVIQQARPWRAYFLLHLWQIATELNNA